MLLREGTFQQYIFRAVLCIFYVLARYLKITKLVFEPPVNFHRFYHGIGHEMLALLYNFKIKYPSIDWCDST